jgi:hypothetical protein
MGPPSLGPHGPPAALMGPPGLGPDGLLPWALEGPRALEGALPWVLEGPVPWALGGLSN